MVGVLQLRGSLVRDGWWYKSAIGGSCRLMMTSDSEQSSKQVAGEGALEVGERSFTTRRNKSGQRECQAVKSGAFFRHPPMPKARDLVKDILETETISSALLSRSCSDATFRHYYWQGDVFQDEDSPSTTPMTTWQYPQHLVRRTMP